MNTLEYFDKLVVHKDRVIRQELFTNYHIPIKADLKKYIPGQLSRQNYLDLQRNIRDIEEEKDMQDLDNMSQELQYNTIRTVVSLFENLEEIPLSSRQLKGVLHSHGVNIRYLGRVTSQLT